MYLLVLFLLKHTCVQVIYCHLGILQFTVRATDNGRPSQSADATVIISVQRVALPIISQPFENTIREDIAEGVSVITVNASHPLGVSYSTLNYHFSSFKSINQMVPDLNLTVKLASILGKEFCICCSFDCLEV